MRVSRYKSASDFLVVTQTFLERRESFNTLMLGICRSLINPAEQSPEFFLWTVNDEQGLHIAALLTPPHELLIYAESLDWRAITVLAHTLRDQNIALPGVVGAAEIVHAFADLWAIIKGTSWSVRRNSRIYELRQVIFPPEVHGRYIQSSSKHRALVAIWLIDFHHGSLDLANAIEIANVHIDKGTMVLWEREDKPVSMAVGPTRVSEHGGMINFVYTPPEERRNGYATALVAALSQKILDCGKEFCCLFTNLANPTSNSIYQKIGYIPCGDFDEVKFRSRD